MVAVVVVRKVESIRQFPDQPRFAQMLADAGFSRVFYENMTLGVVAMHSGFKFPSDSA
jgi:ubiquinone/menaquinone biosynthesis C-methylase UbiE